MSRSIPQFLPLSVSLLFSLAWFYHLFSYLLYSATTMLFTKDKIVHRIDVSCYVRSSFLAISPILSFFSSRSFYYPLLVIQIVHVCVCASVCTFSTRTMKVSGCEKSHFLLSSTHEEGIIGVYVFVNVYIYVCMCMCTCMCMCECKYECVNVCGVLISMVLLVEGCEHSETGANDTQNSRC